MLLLQDRGSQRGLGRRERCRVDRSGRGSRGRYSQKIAAFDVRALSVGTYDPGPPSCDTGRVRTVGYSIPNCSKYESNRDGS